MTESPHIAVQGGVRADARRNRERVLVAARAVFAERGIDAPMATVARRAGVGVATLYRHFPTRDVLVRGAYEQQMQNCAQALTRALAAPDPWQGFQQLVEELCALQREERGFPAAFVAAFPEKASDGAQSRYRAEQDFITLMDRAKASGALRADFHPSDLVVVLLAHCGLVTALPDDAEASRRLVAYLLDAFRADAGNGALPPPSALTVHSLPVAADISQDRRAQGA
ncbi:TetR/AcrR family transcriptional regulator [Streptomyces parvulus]|uniref:TetR/AcrR family transcriptional regulator n=1 Tax=Streptomyces parvulus TaxID=146923 RepID=A0A369UTW8_9ACTN|nr:TetR/AcrR family transcriptional regulator [Streptomyces parvulus]RDD84166.1 TetR/AcrR family transcriptional regulator [Streptomyces parvulus]